MLKASKFLMNLTEINWWVQITLGEKEDQHRQAETQAKYHLSFISSRSQAKYICIKALWKN